MFDTYATKADHFLSKLRFISYGISYLLKTRSQRMNGNIPFVIIFEYEV